MPQCGLLIDNRTKTERVRLARVVMLTLLMLPLTMVAQELEYKLELGACLGTDFYLGDVSSKPFKHPGAIGGVVARRVFNPRMVLKGNLAVGHISGSSDGFFIPTDATDKSPAGGVPTTVSFSRNLVDFGAQFEFNFWGYGEGGGYKQHSRITPYAVAGAGFTLATKGGTDFAFNVPLGAGVKYKIAHRLNVGAEWTVRFTTSDKLDAPNTAPQLNQPYNIQSSGFKNKDCYSCLMFFITYDLCPKYRKCNN